jgi:hypothetical protein
MTYNVPTATTKRDQGWGAWEALIQRFDAHAFPVLIEYHAVDMLDNPRPVPAPWPTLAQVKATAQYVGPHTQPVQR